MSKDNVKKKRTREEKKKLAIRVVAMIMAILMVLGVAYYTIVILASAVRADSRSSETEVLDTSSLKRSGDVLISVGLTFGSSVAPGVEVVSEEGFVLGAQTLTGKRQFAELWELDDADIVCAVDDNLAAGGGSYSVAKRERDTVVGGYHVEVDCYDCDREELEDLLYENRRAASRLGYALIPAYIDGYYMIRVGSFANRQDAEEAMEEMDDLFPRRRMDVVGPTDTAVAVVNPANNAILFEFDCGGETELGMTSRKDRNGNTYITTTSGNVYDGVFAFKRAAGGVSLINILPIEAYIAGVLPFETSNAWPIETQKAFAITVRSFTLTHCGENGKHKSEGFDLCNEVDCQVYRGAGRINDAVMEAVLGTAGKVMTYEDAIVTAYYSSSMGGVTVSAQDAWGGKDDVPYLQPIETPWEDYMNHENAFWINEISPSALLDRMRLAGYNQLRGEIEDVEIVEFARNSTYIKTLRVTDSYGTSVDITTTDAVRTSLTPYVKSANFVVGRGSVEYTEDIAVNDGSAASPASAPGAPAVYDIAYGYMNLDDFYVITSSSEERTYFSDSVQILTDAGTVDYAKRDIFAITRQNADAFEGSYVLEGDAAGIDDSAGRFNTETVFGKSTDTTAYKIAYAENPDNFIFVGKGWGHGVGMSQWGAFDLAVRGYTAIEILETYFLNVDIMDYYDTKNYR